MDDHITTMFAGITPEDFFRDTSAIGTTSLPPHIALGEDPWNQWVNGLIELAAHRCTAGNTDAVAVLRSTRQQRIFTADEDETPDHWAARLRREAFNMGAIWFFLVMLAPGRATDEDVLVTKIERTETAIDAAIDAGALDIGLCWVADRRDAAGVSGRAGIIKLTEDGQPGERVEGFLDEGSIFANVIPWRSPCSEEDDHAV